MLHAGIRALNSLADLEILQSFYGKYFGNTVENRNPTLVEVLHFEEEILRQKIMWKEKYESVISSWITPKSAKSDLIVYKIDEGHGKTGKIRTENNVIKPGEEKQSVGGVKAEETNQKSITLPKTEAPEADQSVVVDVTEIQTPSVDTGKKPEPAVVIATNENAPPIQESTLAAVEQMKPAAEEIKTAIDEVKPAATEEKKMAIDENIKPASAEEKKTADVEIKPAAEEKKTADVEIKPATEEKKTAAVEIKPEAEEKKTAAVEIKSEAEEKKTAAVEIKPEAEEINKPAVARAAKSSKNVTTEDEKLAHETRESAQPEVNSTNEEANDERKPEAPIKRNRKELLKRTISHRGIEK